MDQYDESKEHALISLEEMERAAGAAADYDLQGEIRSLIQMLVRIDRPRSRYPNY